MPPETPIFAGENVIVQLRFELPEALELKDWSDLPPLVRSILNTPEHTSRRLFSPSSIEALNVRLVALGKSSEQLPPLGRYYVAGVANLSIANELVDLLRDRADVETAYVQGGRAPNTTLRINPEVPDPLERYQTVLLDIDAKAAEAVPGGKGERATVMDLEAGWDLTHPELVGRVREHPSGVSRVREGHGMATLLTLGARRNGKGGVGVCPYAELWTMSQYRRTGLRSISSAAVDAAAALPPGAILLIEEEYYDPSGKGPSKIPIEYDKDVFDALRAARMVDLVVIEPAGNGGMPLADVRHPERGRVFAAHGADPAGSGAILVGSSRRNSTSYSNFGTRVDCFTWDEVVVGNRAGVALDFPGTSGSAAIVAGVAASLQSMYREANGSHMKPDLLRMKLTDPGRATVKSSALGVMPRLIPP